MWPAVAHAVEQRFAGRAVGDEGVAQVALPVGAAVGRCQPLQVFFFINQSQATVPCMY